MHHVLGHDAMPCASALQNPVQQSADSQHVQAVVYLV